ncbi:NitT/TauT family transport system permease protein [Ilumatobacter fluminis]|uniref:NitT/TauT family transport system permease protein n=1 Tax=Ilumatobacter fluminis TaxID=467091 RepID=A0A4R7I1C2_9ACTN|nr:ABC transporter permease [Ilumatobacter fluminis]TDT17357.1 NitT/TauT family transport system permease protein [Ilumatobacter fluminis]
MTDRAVHPTHEIGAIADGVDVESLLLADAKGARRDRIMAFVAPVVGVVGFLAAWQLLVDLFDVERFVLPAPIDIFRHLAGDPGFYVDNAKTTMWEAFLGFAIAMVLALVAATVMAHSRFAERAGLPLAVLIQVTPIIAYAPAVVVWLGFGLKPIIVITTLVCFVPFLINAIAGLRSVDPNLLELARSVDAPRRVIFWRLRLPSSMPFLFSAARIAVGLALIGAVLGEFFAGTTSGLGYAVKTAQARPIQLLDQLWASIFVLGFIGATATLLIAGLERITLHWHQSTRH